MAYAKFDDPIKRVSQKVGNIYEAAPLEAIRKALIGISNRVCGGTSGTGHVPTLAGCGTGATGGVQIGNVVSAVINGRLGTITAQANLELPAGTQAAATYVKYLISSAFGSAGTVTAGNEGTSSTKAYLPDLPDGHVALGYVEYAANGTRGFIRTHGVLSGDTGGTNGTVNAWKDLVCIPYADEP
jgi:hypothetical protein